MPKLLLASVLKKKKLSKREFAKRLEIHYRMVFRYCRPGYDPKLSTLEKWAKVLKVPIRHLYKE
jgi:transcriptional regulator with XRE-family HTH domain